MDHQNGQPQRLRSRGRETLLAVILAVFVGFGAVFFLIFVTGGFFAWVILVAIGFGLLIGLHYFLWGWSMEPSVEAERRAMEADHPGEEPASPRSPRSPRPWERRF